MNVDKFVVHLRRLLNQTVRGVEVSRAAAGGVGVWITGKLVCHLYLYQDYALIFGHDYQTTVEFMPGASERDAARRVAYHLNPRIALMVQRMKDLSDELRSELDPILPEP